MRIINRNTKHSIYIRKYICELILINNLSRIEIYIFIYIHLNKDLNKEFIPFILHEEIQSNFKICFVYLIRYNIRQKCKKNVISYICVYLKEKNFTFYFPIFLERT